MYQHGKINEVLTSLINDKITDEQFTIEIRRLYNELYIQRAERAKFVDLYEYSVRIFNNLIEREANNNPLTKEEIRYALKQITDKITETNSKLYNLFISARKIYKMEGSGLLQITLENLLGRQRFRIADSKNEIEMTVQNDKIEAHEIYPKNKIKMTARNDEIDADEIYLDDSSDSEEEE